MGRIAADQITQLKERVDITEVIGVHVRLKKVGRNFVGLCPFHQEKTPSFSVNRERGFFYCFGCSAGGTAFDFLMRIEGLSFAEAARSLANRCGVQLAENDEPGLPRGERDSMLLAARTAADFFAHVLWETRQGADARDYLKGRGITPESARHFGIGFAPPGHSLAQALARRNLLEAGLRIGLVRKDAGSNRDAFRARVMFPIRDAQGRAIAFGGRVLDQTLPKYINSPESPLYSKARSVYGLHEARAAISKNERAIVVEGYIDAIALAQAGFPEVVAGLGTALTADQLRLVGRYTRNIYVGFDGDAAGQRASMRALSIFFEAGILGRGIFIPSGFDPDTFVREKGPEEFSKLIGNARLLVDYYLDAEARTASGSIADRAAAAARVAAMLQRVTNPFEFDLLARRAGDLGVGEAVIRREGLKARSGANRPGPPKAAQIRPSQRLSDAELGLASLAMAFPELRGDIARKIEKFADPTVRELMLDLCGSEDTSAEHNLRVMSSLPETYRRRIIEQQVISITESAADALELARDYMNALDRRDRARAAKAMAQSAAAGNEQEALERAQQTIAMRRGVAKP
ncbi:MAG TPA: DNA primase [Candidatus Binataceae bacterium]